VNFIEPNADSSKISETSVHQVVSQGQYGSPGRVVGVAQPLLERGVGINAQDEGHIMMTPSHLQYHFGPAEIAQALLDHGANVNARINGGETSLYQEFGGEYHIQYDDLGTTQRLTRAWRRRARKK